MNNQINNEILYRMALKKIWELMQQNPEKNTELGNELEMLVALVEAYESIHYQMPIYEPIEIIKQRMKEKNLKQKDLIEFIGNKNRVSKILNKKSELTSSMIHKLSKGLNIPIDRLI